MRVSRSGFYAWSRRSRRPCSATQCRRQALRQQIRRAFESSRRTYGSRRVAAELVAGGTRVCRNTVMCLMRQDGLQSVVRRRKRRLAPRTTDTRHDHPVAPNLLARDFTAEVPNRKWTADITYIPTAEGFLYLAAVLDCFSRRIVGWNMLDCWKGELVRDASRMALLTRRPSKQSGLIHHSDRGSQYAADAQRALLAGCGVRASMSRKGDCYDNAMMESFFSTFKSECVDLHDFATKTQARSCAFEFIEVFYNRQRRHSALNYLSPEEFEKRHETATKNAAITQSPSAH
jgi:putative transposase